jgi:hypothetical protein
LVRRQAVSTSTRDQSTRSSSAVVEGTDRCELVDANVKVRWSSVGDNRVDAYLSWPFD